MQAGRHWPSLSASFMAKSMELSDVTLKYRADMNYALLGQGKAVDLCLNKVQKR